MPSLPQPSVKPICPYFYSCGGCDSQDISYRDQIAYKESWLKELLSPVAFDDKIWQPFLASSDEFPVFFRNKLRFSFIREKGRVWPSRHRKGEEAADIAVDRCFLQSELSNALINEIASYAENHNWSLYTPYTGAGWLKHVLIRESKAYGKLLVSLVTNEGAIPEQESFITHFTNRFPELISLWQTVSWGKGNEQLHDIHLWGEEYLLEKVGHCQFYISPQSFFQTNGSLVELLYQTIAKTAAVQKTENVWDLYAGSATIGAFISQQAGAVVSIEENPANIKDARQNILANKLSNVTVVPGRVEQVVSTTFIEEHGTADCIIVDPPRAGLHEKIRRVLSNLPAHRLIYVSCNPLTFRRDAEELLRQGYRLESIRGIDMFPHSWHCELIAEFRIIKV